MSETTQNHSSAAVLDPPKTLATEAAMMPHLDMSDSISILGSAPWPDQPWWQRIAPSTIYVLLSSAIAIFFLAHELVLAGHLGFPIEDAWIRVTYAKNFFHHLAFEYAPGQLSPAPTSPFWIVVLSLAVNLFHDPILACKLLGSIFLFLTGYYCFRLLRALDIDYGTSMLAGVLLMTASGLAWAELSGLESTLSTALIVGALWWHFSHPGKVPDWLHFFVTGAILAIGTLTRPEISIVFAILVLWQFLQNDQEKFRHCSMLAIGFVVVLVPVALTNFAVSGAFVPATFHGAIQNDSLFGTLPSGNLAGIIYSFVLGFAGIWAAIRDVYLNGNPVWIFTILAALESRRRRTTIERDAADSVFSLTVFILIAYPYFHAVLLGDADSFGIYERVAHFLIPIYTLAGILSIRILARNELFRSMSPKTMIIGSAILLLVAGCTYLLLGTATSNSPVTPFINCLLLLFFTGFLLFAGFRHANLSFFKKAAHVEVTEAERLKTHFSFHEDGREDGLRDVKLSAPAITALHAVLIVLLAWNVALLPRSANDFAMNVRATNHARMGETSIDVSPKPVEFFSVTRF